MHILFHQENQIDSFKYDLLINSVIGMEELVESVNFKQNLSVYSFKHSGKLKRFYNSVFQELSW